jgi:hypothetical protein
MRKPTLGMQVSGFRFLWKYLESISAEHQSHKGETPKPHVSGPLDEVRDQARLVPMRSEMWTGIKTWAMAQMDLVQLVRSRSLRMSQEMLGSWAPCGPFDLDTLWWMGHDDG